MEDRHLITIPVCSVVGIIMALLWTRYVQPEPSLVTFGVLAAVVVAVIISITD